MTGISSSQDGRGPSFFKIDFQSGFIQWTPNPTYHVDTSRTFSPLAMVTNHDPNMATAMYNTYSTRCGKCQKGKRAMVKQKGDRLPPGQLPEMCKLAWHPCRLTIHWQRMLLGQPPHEGTLVREGHVSSVNRPWWQYFYWSMFPKVQKSRKLASDTWDNMR